MGQQSDAELIAKSLVVPDAFAAIFDRHAQDVLAFLERQSGPSGGTLLGDVFGVAFEKRSRFDPDQPSALPWLLGIARNQCLHRARKQARWSRAKTRLPDEAGSPDEDDWVAVLDARAMLPEVARSIAALPSVERDVLVLRVWGTLEYAEIARIVDVPIGTVRSRLNRARRRLREPTVEIGKGTGDLVELLDRERKRIMSTIEHSTNEHLSQGIVPQLPYEDIAAAVDFLVKTFGFREHEPGRISTSDGRVVHAEVRVGKSIIMLGTQGGHGAFTPRSIGRASQILTVYIDDVDRHCERARSAGAEIIAEPKDEFYGDRVYEVEDLAGHRWRFHQHTGRTFEPPDAF